MKGFGAAQKPRPTAPQKQATENQEKQFELVLSQGKLALFDEEFMPHAAKLLETSPTPVDGMAKIGAAIGTQLYMSAFKSGNLIEPIVLIEAGRKLMDDVGEFANASGVTVSPDDVENAFYMAADMTRANLVSMGAFNQDDIEDEAMEVDGLYDADEMAALEKRVADARGMQARGMREMAK